MDLYGDPARRDDVSPFVQLLWDRGAAHEKQIVAEIGQPFVDLSGFSNNEKERRTLEAMDAGATLIYSGRLTVGDLVGEPDLLRKELGGYVAGDIKSGSGEEAGDGDASGKPKKAYAVQLGLYTDTLERLGRSAGRRGFIWDIRGDEAVYDFTTLYGARSTRLLWDDYQDALTEARRIVASSGATLPAYSAGNCKNCVWYSACIEQLEQTNDLTLIPELGRSKRDALITEIGSIKELADINPAAFVSGKKTIFPGIGLDTLEKLHARAKLISTPNAKPYLRAPIKLPVMARELFFDIEVDPMRDTCYLHGFVERKNGDNASEKFLGFFADDDSSGAEERAFI
jgi:predicted RecB family nuclease